MAGPPSAGQSSRAPAAARDESDLAIVNRQADERVKQGFRLAERGAMHSARAEFIQALRLVAQALDAQESTASHSEALSAGLAALRESRDFVSDRSSPEEAADIAHIIQGHRTPVFKAAGTAPANTLVAQQKYLTYAQERLASAAGHQPSASQALYGLGRLATMSAGTPAASTLGDVGVAAASYQAALATDDKNFRAGNELGVIFGNCGRLEAARDVFRRSLTASPQAVTWRNLATIHERLGERQLAEQALARAQTAPGANSVPVDVAWVDPQTFARTLSPVAPTQPSSPAQVAGPNGQSSNTARLPGGSPSR
jgi:tetratricopeptide (TPR) repeat protein